MYVTFLVRDSDFIERYTLGLMVDLPREIVEQHEDILGRVYLHIAPTHNPSEETIIGMDIETAKMFRGCLDVDIAFLERNPAKRRTQ